VAVLRHRPLAVKGNHGAVTAKTSDNIESAMLARRSMQQLLDESGGYLTPEQRQRLVLRLDRSSREAIDAEWELIVLTALASAGDVEHEPDLGGKARLDLRFRSQLVRFVGDVRAINDETLHSENPIHQLSAEFGRITNKLQSEGIEGSLDFRVNGVEAAAWKGRYKTKLILPRAHEFRHLIFDARFRKFLAGIRSEPDKVRHHVVENERASVSVVFNPGGNGMRCYTCPPYNIAHDPIRNGIYENLERKAKQLKRAGQRLPGELAGVFLCDAGCAMLRHYGGVGTTLDRILATFLRNSKTVDFVCIIDVRPADPWARSEWPLKFEVRVWSMREPAFDQSLTDLLNEGFSRIPPPVRTPIATLNHLAWAAEGPRSRLYATHLRNGTMTVNSVEISLRAAMDYLAGRIDRAAFERIVHPDWLRMLRKHLGDGHGVSGVSIKRYSGADDDGFVIDFGGHDASAASFRPIPQEDATGRENNDD
jgi:hypothetical protein